MSALLLVSYRSPISQGLIPSASANKAWLKVIAKGVALASAEVASMEIYLVLRLLYSSCVLLD